MAWTRALIGGANSRVPVKTARAAVKFWEGRKTASNEIKNWNGKGCQKPENLLSCWSASGSSGTPRVKAKVHQTKGAQTKGPQYEEPL